MISGKIHRLPFVLGFTLSLIVSAISGQERGKPNILFIAVDDLKPLLGCYGDSLAQTPHIDSLAAKGVCFTRSYCQQAICAPSRASLLSSRYPDQTRVWDLSTQMRDMDPGIVTLPEYLIQMGYETSGTGKIFDPRSVDNAHDTPSWSVPFRFPWNAKYYNAESGKPAAYFYASQEAKDSIAILETEADLLGIDRMSYVKEHYFPAYESADVPLDAYTDGAIANVGIELIQEAANRADPFFLAIGFNRPHLPFNAPLRFWELYDRDDFSLAAFREVALGSPAVAYHNYEELRSYTGIPESGNISESLQIKLIHGYYAATSYIDQLVGNVIAELSELGLEDNTIIVLWGDHGWHLGDHGLWCKHSNFEEATRTPLIIFDPRRTRQESSCSSPVEFTDIAPTLCEMAGLPIPGYFEGESLSTLLDDPLKQVRQASMSQYPRNGKMGYSLRNERYRYTLWTNSDGSSYAEELYDYQEDSLETINLTAHPDYSDVKHELDSLVKERISIPSTQNRISFYVKELSVDGEPEAVEGISLTLAGETKASNVSGEILFTHPDGSVAYSVSADGYKQVDGVFHIDGDMEISILLERKESLSQVVVQAFDHYTGKKLINAYVLFGSEEQQTNSDGKVTFQVAAGNYPIHVQKYLYNDIVETLTISGDSNFHLPMKATHSTIKVRLHDGATPVNNTRVKVADTTILSNSLGISRFDLLPTNLWYDYRVDLDGYNSLSGKLFLVADSTVDLEMTQVSDADSREENFELLLRPNPSRDFIICSMGAGQFIESIQVIDMLGCRVLQKQGKDQSLTLDIRPLMPGIYWICARTKNNNHLRKLIKYQ
jgi:iduronate 2-sulfatase